MDDIQAQVAAAANELGVDPDFAVRIARQESGFKPDAVSPKGAQGVMQVMPGTAKELAPRYGNDNIRMGVGYLKDLGEIFSDVPEAQRQHFIAAAYNAGPGRITEIAAKVKAQGKDPLDLANYADFLPEETLNYVASIGEAQAPGAVKALRASVGAAAPRKLQSGGQALMSALASEGERQRAAVGRAGESIRGLVHPTGEASPGAALASSGRAILDTLDAAQPVLSPAVTAGGVAGETAARTGAVPLTPEQGAMAGKLGAGVLTLSPKMLTGGVKALVNVEKMVGSSGVMTPAVVTMLMRNPERVGDVVTLMLGRMGLRAASSLARAPKVQALLGMLSRAAGNKVDTIRILGALAGEVQDARQLSKASQ